MDRINIAIFFMSAILLGGPVATADAASFATLFLHIIVENPAAQENKNDCIYYAVDMSTPEDNTPDVKVSIRYISSGRHKKLRNLTAMLNTEIPGGEITSMHVNRAFPDINEELLLSSKPQDLFICLFEEGATMNFNFKLPAGAYSRVSAGKSYKVTYTLTDLY